MTVSSPNTTQIAHYLLGRLSEDERTRFEEKLLQDDALFEGVEEAESRLIDDYVFNNLSSDDLHQFELHFLQNPKLRERVEFTRALHEVAVERKREREKGVNRFRQTSPGISKRSRSWWASLSTWPQAGALAAASAVIALGALGLILLQNARLRAELNQAQAEQASQQRQSADQLADANEKISETERQLSKDQDLLRKFAETLDKPAPQRSIFSAVLSSFVESSRGGVAPPLSQQILIPPGTDLVRLEAPIQIKRTDFISYMVSLWRGDNQIWHRNVRASKPGGQITIRLPASLFGEGGYSMKLTGVLAENHTEGIGEYQFTVARR
jgi:anti-sigma factor RsiW